MKLDEFDYALPPELIAQEPLADRAGSRMLVVDRAAGKWEDRRFRDLPQLLGDGDCLVLNDTKVLPSRLFGRRMGPDAGGAVEVFLLRSISGDRKTWQALVRPGRKLRSGEQVDFGGLATARILGRGEFGERTLRIDCEGEVEDLLERAGHVPLPPYIRRGDTAEDRERYQTVFARESGSVAAPTAGLHFTEAILEACREAGAGVAYVTLHVGLGTFQPIHSETVEAAKLHSEHFHIAEESALRMREAKRLVAVGTTSVRAIESALSRRAPSGETDLFIYPGFIFRGTGAMLTNFHLPRSSLFILASAFGGRELIRSAYEHAIGQRYRFYSYGDCMLIV